jgi:ubiquinol-cytochrome c reductase cytochrome b subunit
MLRATTDLMVYVFMGIVALAAVLAILRGGFRAGGKIAIAVAAVVVVFLLKSFDAKFWGVVVMGAAVLILFVLPWLDRSPVKSIRYRPDWHKYVYAIFVFFFLVLGYLGSQPPSASGNYISQIGTLVYFGFFLLMPWWSRVGTFKPVPNRVTFKSH